MPIDSDLPTYDVRDYHQVQVEAPAGTAYAVLRSFDLNRSRIVRTLFAIRSLSSRLLRIKSPPPPLGIFLEQALAAGWVILEKVPGRELVAGAVTQPWMPDVRFHGLATTEFVCFSRPSFTKIVGAIAARPLTPEASLLSMETHILVADPASRHKFRLYWLIVCASVRLIRVIALTTAGRELERARHAAASVSTGRTNSPLDSH
jgi:hypothetical protein